MRIAVIGASGKTGSAVAQRALSNGDELRAVVRNPESCANLARNGAEIVTCDLDDSDGVRSALAGADAVYYCSPLPTGHDQPFAVERSRAQGVISAAVSAGVNHFVLLSAMGPDTAPGIDLIETKRAIEKELAASGLGYTVLRPSMFMDNVAMAGPGVLQSVGLTWPYSESALIQPIAAADIAQAAVRAIIKGPGNQTFDLVGPEAITFRQMADELGRAMGTEVQFTEISDAVFIEHVGPAMGSTQGAQAIAATYRLWERDGSGTGDVSILKREFNVMPMHFHEYATKLVEAWKKDGLV